jgi:hypothetical protein
MQSVRIMFEGVNINWDESKLEAVFWAPTGGGRRNGVKPVIGRQASNWSNSMRAQRKLTSIRTGTFVPGLLYTVFLR